MQRSADGGAEESAQGRHSDDKLVGAAYAYVPPMSLLPGDKTIDLALYVDNTFTEAYWMGGRVAMTVDTETSGGHDDVTISASRSGTTVSATVWQVGSIWVTPEAVKQTPRRDDPDDNPNAASRRNSHQKIRGRPEHV